MGNQYSYAKDWRSDQQYKRNFDQGVRDQALAIEQYAIELQMVNPALDIKYESVGDVPWVKDDNGVWHYNPDYYVDIDGTSLPYEVKVARRGTWQTIDFKRSQVAKLAELGGQILYATKDQYSLIDAKELIGIAEPTRSDKFGGKEVLTIRPEQLNWRYWVHSPF